MISGGMQQRHCSSASSCTSPSSTYPRPCAQALGSVFGVASPIQSTLSLPLPSLPSPAARSICGANSSGTGFKNRNLAGLQAAGVAHAINKPALPPLTHVRPGRTRPRFTAWPPTAPPLTSTVLEYLALQSGAAGPREAQLESTLDEALPWLKAHGLIPEGTLLPAQATRRY